MAEDVIGQSLANKRDPRGVPPNTELFCGYLAPADETDQELQQRTLFLDPSGARCCFIPIDSIIDSQPIEAPASPLGFGGTALSVKKGSDVRVQTNETVRAGEQASFLQGGITDGAQVDMGQAPGNTRFLGELVAVTSAINTGGQALADAGVFKKTPAGGVICNPLTFPDWSC